MEMETADFLMEKYHEHKSLSIFYLEMGDRGNSRIHLEKSNTYKEAAKLLLFDFLKNS